MTDFLKALVRNAKITGGDPNEFWRGVGVLDIQQGGNSQKEMNEEFDKILKEALDYSMDDCEPTSGKFLYLDDAVFSGLRLKSDLVAWLPQAPASCEVLVVVLGLHRGGCWYTEKELKKAADAVGKKVKLHFWRCVEFEDRKSELNNTDVLRPSTLGDDPLVWAYAEGLAREGYPVQLRGAGGVGEYKMFSSSEARELFEQMLKKGAYVRSVAHNLPSALRPLGFTGLRMLGFGGILVTYRNCPNNCPLPYWVDAPTWDALFPRRTNAQSAMGRNSLWT